MTLGQPYWEPPDLVLVGEGRLGEGVPALSLKPFGVLVAAGVYLGALCAVRYGARRGLHPRALASFIFHVVGCGFVFGHVLDVLLYAPERLAQDPWALARLWDGLSSFGGFCGAIIGMLIWRSRYKTPVQPYADNVIALFPVGWVFGRAGCSTAHDHPGLLSDSWLAVRYPGGARFDLGLLELLLTIPLALAFLWLARKPRPWGFFASIACVVYAPLRFALDFLREHEDVPGDVHGAIDPRYFYLTPAQWECFALLAFGLVLLIRVLRSVERGGGYERPVVPAVFQSVPVPSGSKP